MNLSLSNRYLSLGEAFCQQELPTPVVAPELLLWNSTLAQTIGITGQESNDAQALAQYFSGNKLIDGSQPIVQAYSGHQFGRFNPQLGDGRAHLLGDVTDSEGQSWDIQLKGSGISCFSRRGDGRCALGPALREYIMSEAMFALGIPTTRCLAVVATGERVYRTQTLPGAVVTRIATSHIRVGTFQYFAVRQDVESLRKLTCFAIERHFPMIKRSKDSVLTAQQVIDFYAAVLEKQVVLVNSWLRVGFIHGVMNTDNTAISGETIDYGPCAMMNHYHEDTVFSSIDGEGRYAFGQQSKIIQWNMARLADCLLPLIDDDEYTAVTKLEPLLWQFADDLKEVYLNMMANKLGIVKAEEGDKQLIDELLSIMSDRKLDYTQTFVDLADSLSLEESDRVITQEVEGNEADRWQLWLKRWYLRVASDIGAAKALMAETNPLVIPRNHHVEQVLAVSQNTGDLSALNDFLRVLQHPYSQLAETHLYQDIPSDGDENYQTFCGT